VRHLHPISVSRVVRSAARFLLAVALPLLACGKDHKPNTLRPPPATVISDSLTFTRAGDTTALAMGTTPLVCCGLYDRGFVNEHAMMVVLYDAGNQKPGWQIVILTDHAQAGTIYTLPTPVVPPSKVPYVSMFVADSTNELNSDTQESSGTITVNSFRCTQTAIEIDFTVNAILGSEYWDGPSMGIQGTFKATFPAQSCP
jgi:hypothetical protein